MNKEPIHILSLGAGVQSSTMLLMAEAGIITPKPTCAIFADTKDEPKKVYEWLKKLKGLTKIPVVEVSKGSLMDDALAIKTSAKTGKRYIKGLIPAFVLNADGTKGLLGRKCTPDYKIEQIVRQARKIVGKEALREWRAKHKAALKRLSVYYTALRAWKKAKREKQPLPLLPEFPQADLAECKSDPLVVMWIGISTDEADRMKESQEPWIRTRWPIIEADMSRDGCVSWCLERGFPIAPRSACKKCPFHSDDEWIIQRDQEPEEFAESVAWEKELQAAARNQEQLKGIPYLHDSCVPLDQVKFIPTSPGKKQLSLFSNECAGLCGV